MASNPPLEAPAVAETILLAADSPAEEISIEFLLEEVSIDGMCGVY